MAGRIAIVSSSVPRGVRWRQKRPVVIYSDASGKGHVAVVIFIDGKRRSLDTHLPQWMVGERGIYEFELSAILVGVTIASEMAQGRAIYAFCDNTAAGHAAIRGSNKTRTGRAMCSAIWAALSHTSPPLRLEYANAKFNPSGEPSRECVRPRRSYAACVRTLNVTYRGCFGK